MMPNLIGSMMADCAMLTPQTEPDGQGGNRTIWTEGRRFSAAIVKTGTVLSTAEGRRAAAQTYTVTTPAGVGLAFDGAFRRIEDGATFRVTSDSADSRPPACASFDFEQVTAERWEIP